MSRESFQLLGILILVVLAGMMAFFYPKKTRLSYGMGACFSDRCLGFTGEMPACYSSGNYVENCYKTCYGYVYNKCDNRSLPVNFAKKILNALGIQWSGS